MKMKTKTTNSDVVKSILQLMKTIRSNDNLTNAETFEENWKKIALSVSKKIDAEYYHYFSDLDLDCIKIAFSSRDKEVNPNEYDDDEERNDFHSSHIDTNK